MQLNTAKMTVYPTSYEGKSGTVYQTNVVMPVDCTIEFAPNGKKTVAQLKSILDKAQEETLQVELEYILKQGRYNNTIFVVYDADIVKNKVSVPTT